MSLTILFLFLSFSSQEDCLLLSPTILRLQFGDRVFILLFPLTFHGFLKSHCPELCPGVGGVNSIVCLFHCLRIFQQEGCVYFPGL